VKCGVEGGYNQGRFLKACQGVGGGLVFYEMSGGYVGVGAPILSG